MNLEIKRLEPARIWHYFEEILRIPRPSRKEEKIIAYILDFAVRHKLDCRQDLSGNILITKPASAGFEDRKPVILQSHLDMVGEKNSDIRHDFDQDAIDAYLEDGWVKAHGTTLGADDGIGIAAQLAILEARDIPHGPLECLFTTDEESGMTGARGLPTGFFTSRILVNLDSEDEGELFIGCAGGIDTIAEFTYREAPIPEGFAAFSIRVNGLKGGHSGDDIDKKRGNSNKILNRFLWEAARKYDLRLCHFDGGNKRNAIPREAVATVAFPANNESDLLADFKSFLTQVKYEYRVSDPDLSMDLKGTVLPSTCIDPSSAGTLMDALYACPHGVKAISQNISGLVETSTNLASVKMDGKGKIIITTSQRSSVESAKRDIANQVSTVFLLAGAEVRHGEGYPAWAPDTDSEILRITGAAYEKLFREKPLVRAIHAGLECGLFLEKYPDLDMISFGPTIKGAHSPDEKLDIRSTKKFWDLLLEVLRSIPAR